MQPNEFLQCRTIAVAGASADPNKYGNIVFRRLLASGRTVFAINPKGIEIEGHRSYRSLRDLPVVPETVSIVTPPMVTRMVVADAIAVGVRSVWMQPGAEDPVASQSAIDAGLSVIDDGSCILVALAVERARAGT
jgi:uncharacterized protein